MIEYYFGSVCMKYNPEIMLCKIAILIFYVFFSVNA